MFDLKIPDTSLDEAVEFVERVANLFDEVYATPKRAGVQGIVARNNERKILQQALHYVSSSLGEKDQAELSPINAAKVPILNERLREIGKLLGFNPQGYIKKDTGYSPAGEVDFAKPIAHLNGHPFFVWRPHYFVTSDLEMAFERGKWDWRDRELGPIDDSRDNVAYGAGGITVFTKRPNALNTHGMTILKSKSLIPDDADTQLQINYCWDFMEGFMNNIHVNFRDGEVISTYGTNLIEVLTTGRSFDTGDVEQTLQFITDTIKITPQQFLYYIMASNLTDDHRADLGILLRTAESQKSPTYFLPTGSVTPVEMDSLALVPTTRNNGTSTLEALSNLPARDIGKKEGVVKGLLRQAGLYKRSQPFFTLAEDHDVDPDTLTPTYDSASYSNITPKQFQAARFKEGAYDTLWIDFQSPKGNNYSVGHLTFDDGDSRIRIISKDKDREDFLNVQQMIADHFRSRTESDITDRDNDFCSDIHLKKNAHSYGSVQKALGEFYQPTFAGVGISSLHMKNVTLDDLTQIGLPMDTVKYGDAVLR
jgi:hypothetical protein